MTRPVEVSDAHHAWLVSEDKRRGCTPAELLQALVEVEVAMAPPVVSTADKVLSAVLLVLLLGVVVWMGASQW